MAARRSGSSALDCTLSIPVSWLTSVRSAARWLNEFRPTSASTRRLPEPTDCSETRDSEPSWEVEPTWVPPHSSRDHGPFISTTRTSSPYFSPNRDMAPSFLASASGISRVTTSKSSRMAVLAICSISWICSAFRASPWEKSKRR